LLAAATVAALPPAAVGAHALARTACMSDGGPARDIFDDLLRLAVSTRICRRTTLPAGRAARRWLDGSRLSPRRHRVLACVLTAAAIGFALAGWHGLREGPWASVVGAAVFAGLGAGAALVALLVCVFYLDALRPALR
jgi:hypothetical protein